MKSILPTASNLSGPYYSLILVAYRFSLKNLTKPFHIHTVVSHQQRLVRGMAIPVEACISIEAQVHLLGPKTKLMLPRTSPSLFLKRFHVPKTKSGRNMVSIDRVMW